MKMALLDQTPEEVDYLSNPGAHQQAQINATQRRPRVPGVNAWARENSRLPRHLRKLSISCVRDLMLTLFRDVGCGFSC